MSVENFRANNQKQVLNDGATRLLVNFQLFVVQNLKQRPKITYIQSTSYEMLSWMTHKLESRLKREISTISDMQMIPP